VRRRYTAEKERQEVGTKQQNHSKDAEWRKSVYPGLSAKPLHTITTIHKVAFAAERDAHTGGGICTLYTQNLVMYSQDMLAQGKVSEYQSFAHPKSTVVD
jgi:hypothetical protein